MTTEEYRLALKALNLGIASQQTAEVLGVTLRTIQNYAAGEPIPTPISKLVQMYLMHGIPIEFYPKDGTYTVPVIDEEILKLKAALKMIFEYAQVGDLQSIILIARTLKAPNEAADV